MSNNGNRYSDELQSYDNACIESFHSILKKEKIHPHKYYVDYDVASKAIFVFIESWYNRKRIHSSIGYQTPETIYQLANGIA